MTAILKAFFLFIKKMNMASPLKTININVGTNNVWLLQVAIIPLISFHIELPVKFTKNLEEETSVLKGQPMYLTCELTLLQAVKWNNHKTFRVLLIIKNPWKYVWKQLCALTQEKKCHFIIFVMLFLLFCYVYGYANWHFLLYVVFVTWMSLKTYLNQH